MARSSRSNNYWSLKTYTRANKQYLIRHLATLGYDKVHPSRTTAQLNEILHRHKRGQVCYDQYTDQKLVDLSRGTAWAVKAKTDGTLPHATRLRVVNSLQHADNRGSTFDRFLSLPPELRVKVYEHYVARFPKKMVAAVNPPLARTCRLIRQESLLVFYKSRELKLRFDWQDDLERDLFPICSTTKRFFRHRAPEDFACIRRLKLWWFDIYADIGLPRLDLDKRTVTVGRECGNESAYELRVASTLHTGLKLWMSRLPIVDGKTRLTPHAIDRISEIMEKAVNIE